MISQTLSLLTIIACVWGFIVSSSPSNLQQSTVNSQQSTVNRFIVSSSPSTPQRVIVLGNASLEASLSLGITPIGAAPWVAAGNVGQFPGFLPQEAVQNIEYLGDVNQPSLEAIVALHPDLILGNRAEHNAIYPLLSKIAPTILCDVLQQPWEECFRVYAAPLKKSAQAENLILAYQQKIKQLQDKMETWQVSVVRFMPSQVRLYLRGSPIGHILQEVGFSRPAIQDQDRWKLTLSLETIPLADAEVLFVTQSDPQGRLYNKFTRNPLWQNLQAVKSDRVFSVNFETWIGGEGAIAANQVLNDLDRILSQL